MQNVTSEPTTNQSTAKPEGKRKCPSDKRRDRARRLKYEQRRSAPLPPAPPFPDGLGFMSTPSPMGSISCVDASSSFLSYQDSQASWKRFGLQTVVLCCTRTASLVWVWITVSPVVPEIMGMLGMRSKTHKRLKECFLIRRNGTKRANFQGSPLFQATSFFRMLAVNSVSDFLGIYAALSQICLA